ncbi:putative peptidyl-tRNA hydrolase PTRHD1 [Punica granatum]|uniref:peptidyl-tRNA hydrolase n=2 Tax=Punica granatum TaxID=22663 RepID=A0A6P8BSU3_PUNGR|nr:putative peptidyl-tRNA hydrolase PTRHD1 [Punica granatum]
MAMASLVSPSYRFTLSPSLTPFRSLPSRVRAFRTQTRLRLSSTMSQAPPPLPDAPASSGDGEENKQENDVIVQYVVLRRDLIGTWPLGSLVTQGCHASVSAVWEHRDDPLTVEYCSPDKIDSMHKVTLEVKGEPQILNLAEKLKAGGIAHKLWIEQPENIPTCLATKPYAKSTVSSYFKKLKLCK